MRHADIELAEGVCERYLSFARKGTPTLHSEELRGQQTSWKREINMVRVIHLQHLCKLQDSMLAHILLKPLDE